MDKIGLDEILKMAMKKGASDVHLKAGLMPVIRRHGILRPLAGDLAQLSGEDIDAMANKIMDARTKDTFERMHEVDFGYGISGLGRFRINAFKQRGTTRMVIRNIPHNIPSFQELNLPLVVEEISSYERGLVLVTGVTGSGKSSTLAAIIDHINRTKNKHILTIEDPIEFLIRDRKSIITQRELGIDAIGYSNALRAALRQDPDVILIGEMRDKESIEIALLAAETGHLVLSSLHTLDARETVNRIIGAFEANHQHQVRLQLAGVLKAVISQRLARKKDKSGFVPAVEIMINNARVREMIEDRDKTKNIIVAIEEGMVPWGMQSFDQSLLRLLGSDIITFEEALALSSNPEDFRMRYSGVDALDGKKWTSGAVDQKVTDDWHGLSEVEIETPPEFKKRQKQKGKDNSEGDDEDKE